MEFQNSQGPKEVSLYFDSRVTLDGAMPWHGVAWGVACVRCGVVYPPVRKALKGTWPSTKVRCGCMYTF